MFVCYFVDPDLGVEKKWKTEQRGIDFEMEGCGPCCSLIFGNKKNSKQVPSAFYCFFSSKRRIAFKCFLDLQFYASIFRFLEYVQVQYQKKKTILAPLNEINVYSAWISDAKLTCQSTDSNFKYGRRKTVINNAFIRIKVS